MSWIMATISFGVAWIAGDSLLRRIAATTEATGQEQRAIRWFALPVGVAALSGLYWAWSTLVRGPGWGYAISELTLVGLLKVTTPGWRRHSDVIGRSTNRAHRLVAAAAGAMTLAGVIAAVDRWPHGWWDAWVMWTLKAKFLYAAGPTWPATFEWISGRPEYPLLLPATIARAWCYVGSDAPAAARLTSILFPAALVAVLWSGLRLLRGSGIALVGVLTMLASPLLIRTALMQYADLPLAVMMLGATLAASIVVERGGSSRWWLSVCGLMAGAAAWTKDEGLLFAVVLLLTLTVWRIATERGRAWRGIAAMLLSAAPLLACRAGLVWGYAPPNKLLHDLGKPADAAWWCDAARHELILRTVARMIADSLHLWLLLLLMVWLAARGVRRSAGAGLVLITLTIQAAAYVAVFLRTPYDLQWHLDTAAPRLLMHLWPLVILLPAMLARPDQSVGPTN